MFKKFSRLISLFVCIVFTFTFYSNVAFASNQKRKLLKVVNGAKIMLVKNNTKEAVVLVEKDGNELYTTINKEKNEVKMKSVEKSKSKKNITREFVVNFHKVNESKKYFEASITELSTKKTVGFKSLSKQHGVAEWFFIPYLTYWAVEALILAVLALTAITVTVVLAQEVTEVLEKKFRKKNPTIIYRWGSGTPYNLTPRSYESSLSYSLVKPISGYTATTLSAVNATGKLIAIKDAPTHVSVMPVEAWRMQEWKNSRDNANSNPHEFTKILMAISVKVK